MWLLRSGLVQVEDFRPDSLDKYKFMVNGELLRAVGDLKYGDLIEIKSTDQVKQEATTADQTFVGPPSEAGNKRVRDRKGLAGLLAPNMNDFIESPSPPSNFH